MEENKLKPVKSNAKALRQWSERMMKETMEDGVECQNPYCKFKHFMHEGKRIKNKHGRLSDKTYKIQDFEGRVCMECEKELDYEARKREFKKASQKGGKGNPSEKIDDIIKDWENA